jgi:DnaJ homolog subfamily C member 19
LDRHACLPLSVLSPSCARLLPSSSLSPPVVPGGVIARSFHATAPAENTILIATGVGIAIAAIGASYVIRAVDTKNSVERLTNPDGTENKEAKDATGEKPKPAASTGMFSAQSLARRFYRGGFEDRMTRREAALILGVR